MTEMAERKTNYKKMMQLQFKKEHFIAWLKQGLKISHGIMNLSSDQSRDLIPSAPVAFALMFESTSGRTRSRGASVLKPRALIPLQMTKISVKLTPMRHAPSTLVSLKAVWRLPCGVEPQHVSDFLLAIPVDSTHQYAIGGVIVNLQGSTCSDDVEVETRVSRKPMFEDVYFVHRPKVNGGVEVGVNVWYLLRWHTPDGMASVMDVGIPLRFPFYASGFIDEIPIQEKKEKIRINIKGHPNEEIKELSQNNIGDHALKVVYQKENEVVLLRESRGPDIKWSEANVSCNIVFETKEGTNYGYHTSVLCGTWQEEA